MAYSIQPRRGAAAGQLRKLRSAEMLVLCREPDRLDIERSKRREGHSLSIGAFVPQPYVNMRAVLQLVDLNERVRLGGVSEQTSHRLNERLLKTLKAMYRLNASRLQLLNALEMQSSLERLTCVAQARKDQLTALDLRKLHQCTVEARTMVSLVSDAWHQAGAAFTQLTRLLPVQLEETSPRCEPLGAAELDRLARACAATPQGSRAPSFFSEERARYQHAMAQVAATSAQVERASKALRFTEGAFRVGERDVHELAAALIGHSQQRRELMQKTVQACMAEHTLYALAQRLPERLGLN